MTTSTIRLARKQLIIMAGVLAMALAAWGCKESTSKGGGGAGGGGGGGAAGNDTGTGGSCADPAAPEPPAKSCDPTKSASSQCPLPETVSQDDGSYTTVFYYSDPACVGGKCHYCSTSTRSEDPNATGAP